MRSYRPVHARDRPPLRQRASGLALALGVNLLALLLLLTLNAPRIVPMGTPGAIVVIDLASDDINPDQAAPAPAPAEPESRPESRPLPERPPVPPVLPVPVVEGPRLPTRPLDMIEVSRSEYLASDIAGLPQGDRSGAGNSARDSAEVGRGPQGQILYAAEWARKPTDAELGGYLPPNPPDGYGLIICRTVPGNRVEDCLELESYPRGSRLAGAVRQAAWQFRVRPPRKNGRAMVGEWVRIRIEYSFGRIRD